MLGCGTSDRRLTQREVDAWLARVLLDLAEARELAGKVGSPRVQHAVDALDEAARGFLKELGTSSGVPDVSDLIARAVTSGGKDSSSLRGLGRDLRDL